MSEQSRDTTARPAPPRGFMVLAVLAALMLAALAVSAARPRPAPEAARGETVPHFTAGALSRADLPDGTSIVNFFASWCLPCAAEHPVLTKLAAQTPVYGIAFLDKAEDTAAFLERLGDPFAKTGIDAGGEAGAAWRVRGLPTTFVIRDGRILYRLDAPLTDDIAARDIEPFLEQE